MRDWMTLSHEEREAAKSHNGPFRMLTDKRRMDDGLRNTLALLEGDDAAIDQARSIALGCYLVNTPEEIVAYCKAAAEGGAANA